MSPKLTQDELLQEIQRVLAPDGPSPEGMTAPEMAEKFDLSPMIMRRAITRMLADGKLEIVRLRRLNYIGNAVTIKGFRMRNGKP